MPKPAIHIVTEEIPVLKSTVDILKDVVPEAVITATYDKNSMTENSHSHKEKTEHSESSSKKHKSKKKKKKKKSKKHSEDTDQESESNTDANTEKKKHKKKKDKHKKKSKKKKNDSDEESKEEKTETETETGKSKDKKKKNKKKHKGKKKNKEEEDEVENSETKIVKKKKNRNGLKVFKIDKNKILLVSLTLNNFSQFYAAKPQTKIGIEMGMLAKPFKSMEKEGVLTISMARNDERHLDLTLNKKGGSVDTWQIETLDLNEKAYKIPQSKFDIIITMNCAEFHKVCKKMQGMDCEYIEIRCNKKIARFSSLGEGISVCNEYPASEDTEDGGVHIKCHKKGDDDLVAVKNVYELRHFILFSKCKDICHNVRLYLKKDYPVFLKYTVGTLGTMLVGVSPICDKNLHEDIQDDDSYDPSDKTYYKRTEIKAKDD